MWGELDVLMCEVPVSPQFCSSPVLMFVLFPAYMKYNNADTDNDNNNHKLNDNAMLRNSILRT